MDVDIGSDTFAAFADVDFADSFLVGDVARAVPWAAFDDDQKGRGLVSATRMLQQLGWCPDPPPDPAGPDIPPEVQQATAMLAADLLAKPKLFADASGDSNVKSVKAGSAQVEFFSPTSGGPPIPQAIWTMLLNAGLVGCGSDDGTNEGAYVSGAFAGCRPLGGEWPFRPDCRDPS